MTRCLSEDAMEASAISTKMWLGTPPKDAEPAASQSAAPSELQVAIASSLKRRMHQRGPLPDFPVRQAMWRRIAGMPPFCLRTEPVHVERSRPSTCGAAHFEHRYGGQHLRVEHTLCGARTGTAGYGAVFRRPVLTEV